MHRLGRRLLTFAAVAGAAFALHALPRHWVGWGLWLTGGAIAAWVAYLAAGVALTLWRLRRPPAPLPDVAPMPCPACGGTEHEYKVQGLWDGMPDPVTGHQPGGSLGYGVCRRCGSRWGQWDDRPPYVPSDDEWDREVTRPEAARAEQLRLWTEHHARRAPVPPPADGRSAGARRTGIYCRPA